MADIGGNLEISLNALKRRKIFRVAAAYAIGAWVLLQLAEVVFEPLGVPDSALRGLIIAVVLLFPVTIAIAWAFDIGSSSSLPDLSEDHGTPSRGQRWLELGIIGVLVLGVTVTGYFFLQPGDSSARSLADDKSIAVLPFVNMSADPANEYFSDGISEELLNVLTKIDGLRVAARTSSFAYKGNAQNVQNIGQELNVSTVLEGSVRKSANRVRITAQLINVENGFHLWSETYDRELTDIFDVQDEISAAIVAALKVTLLGNTAKEMSHKATRNIDAYELYLKGRHAWHKREAESITMAALFFEQAIASDPNYTLAYTGLADSYMLLEEYGDLDISEARPKAMAAVNKALELDDTLAEAHTSLGLILNSEGKFEEAAVAYRKAIELDPTYSMAHLWYGNTLNALDRPEEVIEQYRIAAKLEPMSYPINANLGYSLFGRGQYLEAIPYFENLVKIRPFDASFYENEIGELNLNAGEFAEAIRWYHKSLESDPLNSQTLSEIGFAYLGLDDNVTAKYWLDLGHQIDPYSEGARFRAIYHLVNDQVDEAIRELQQFNSFAEGKEPEVIMWLLLSAIANDDTALAEKYDADIVDIFGGDIVPSQRTLQFIPIIAAWYLQRGETERGNTLLAAAEKWTKNEIAENKRHPYYYVSLAQIAAIRNNRTDMLDNLRQAINAGWYFTDFIRTNQIIFGDYLDDAGLQDLLRQQENHQREEAAIVQLLQFSEYTLPTLELSFDIDSTALERMRGFYVSGSDEGNLLEIQISGDEIYAIDLGEPKMQMRAIADNQLRSVESTRVITFHANEDGEVTHIIDRYSGRENRMRPTEYVRPQLANVDPAIYDEFAGVYQFIGFTITVERNGGRLFIQPEGQQRFEAFPESQDTYFFEVATIKLSFDRDDNNIVTGVIMHSVEADILGKKL